MRNGRLWVQIYTLVSRGGSLARLGLRNHLSVCLLNILRSDWFVVDSIRILPTPPHPGIALKLSNMKYWILNDPKTGEHYYDRFPPSCTEYDPRINSKPNLLCFLRPPNCQTNSGFVSGGLRPFLFSKTHPKQMCLPKTTKFCFVIIVVNFNCVS